MTGSNRRRRPTPPGDILRREFLEPMGLSQRELARHVGVDVKVVNRIVNGARVTVPMAIRLAAAFGTTPELWLRLQSAVDVFDAAAGMGRLPTRLGPPKSGTLRAFRRSRTA